MNIRKALAYILIAAVCAAVPVKNAGGGAIMPSHEQFGGDLRVGLTSKYKELWSITFTNQIISVGYETDGYFRAECTLSGDKGFVATSDSSYFVKLGTYTNYNEAKAAADSVRQKGYRAAPCLIASGNWTVYAGGYEVQQTAQSAAQSLGGSVEAPNGRRVVLMENNDIAAVFDSVNCFPQFAPQGGGYLSLGERRYRGRIEVARFSGKNLTAVNIISIDSYLFSVLPSEMSSKWHMEALKAQAVACRSYAATRKGVHKSDGYDLCDEAHCQVYLGAANEAETTTAAVNATKDIFIWYNDKPIQAVYFASSGGITDDSENVWSTAEPYLRSVTEMNEKEGKVWNRTYTLEDLDKALSNNGVNIGSATGMTITKTQNNRVQELTIIGTKGVKSLVKEEIRTFFAGLTGGSLESRNFTIISGPSAGVSSGVTLYATNGGNPIPMDLSGMDGMHAVVSGGSADRVNAVESVVVVRSAEKVSSYSSPEERQGDSKGTFILDGRGNGHGVGMSQYGAKGMAEMGYTYLQILNWYYKDVMISK